MGGWVAGQLRLYSLAQPSYAGAFAELGKNKHSSQQAGQLKILNQMTQYWPLEKIQYDSKRIYLTS